MAAIYTKQGALIPLYLQLSDYDTGRFVEAIIKSATTNLPIGASPVDLDDISDGMYHKSSVPQPNDILIVTYVTYKDAGKTVLANQEAGTDIFLRDTISDIDLPDRNDTFIATFSEETNEITATFIEDSEIIGVMSDVETIALTVNDSDALVASFIDDETLTAVIEC